jgi:FkbH-like protein
VNVTTNGSKAQYDDLIASLVALTGDSEEPDLELRAEVELTTARALMRRGELEYAARFLLRATKYAKSDTLRTQIVEQILQIAKSWEKQGGEIAAKRERLLRYALELAPGQAAVPLAQFLQRQGRLQESADMWRESIRHNPQEHAGYLGLARLHKQMGEAEQALEACLHLASVSLSAKNTLVAAGLLDELAPHLPAARPNQTVKVGLLGNATLDHLQNYLKVELYKAGLRPELYAGGFGQYTQEILDPESGLYAFAPDVLVLAIHPSRLFPNLHSFPFDMTVEERRAEVAAGLETMRVLIETFTKRCPSIMLVHNMAVPQHLALGTLDLRDELGQVALFNMINLQLAEMVRDQFRNVYVLDEDAIQSRCGKAQATDERMWLAARLPWSDSVLRALSQEYMRFIRPLKGLNKKCIVLDLDNTLWGGVIGEDGLAGIQLGTEAPGSAYVAFQRELERLWRRGILLAISSKNNLDDAMSVFEQHPDMVLKLSHFAAYQINWEPKEQNIRDIAKELNIGLDSLVFLDDNPMERARVRAELPMVLTPEMPKDPAHYRRALLELGVFDTLALTEEDRNRNKLYAEQQARQQYEATFSSGTLNDYLAGLQMTVDIAPADGLTLPRIAQLTNKTNQFNLTTRRYTEAQIEEMRARGSLVFGMGVADRFGDNGLVGVAIVSPGSHDTWEIDTLLMSCRVMGREAETALLSVIAQQVREHGARHLEGWYIPTAKNAPVKAFYPRHGFTATSEKPDGSVLYTFDLNESEVIVPEWLTLRIKLPVPAALPSEMK